MSTQPTKQNIPQRLVSITKFSSKHELFYVMCDAIRAHDDITQNPSQCAFPISIPNILINANEGSKRVTKETFAYETSYNPKRIRAGVYINSMEDIESQDIWPFQSCDEIMHKSPEKFQRQAHHDLESFFYILLWICMYCTGPFCGAKETTNWSNWLRRDKSGIWTGTHKRETMLDRDLFEERILDKFQPYFDELKPCMRRMRMSIFEDKVKITHRTMVLEMKYAIDPLEIA